jgi:hypothetical protein
MGSGGSTINRELQRNSGGSRFRTNYKKSGLPENDSRPLTPVPLRNTWPGAYFRIRSGPLPTVFS